MTSAERLMVIATPNHLEVGKRIDSLSAMPHLTLFPWMTIENGQWEEFDFGMNEIINDSQARNMRGADEANFGTAEKPTKVRKLYGLDYDLRNDLASLAIDLNAQYDATYTELNTKAHVSDTPGYSLKEGEVFPILALTVISNQIDQNQKTVKAIYKWASASRWYL